MADAMLVFHVLDDLLFGVVDVSASVHAATGETSQSQTAPTSPCSVSFLRVGMLTNHSCAAEALRSDTRQTEIVQDILLLRPSSLLALLATHTWPPTHRCPIILAELFVLLHAVKYWAGA